MKSMHAQPNCKTSHSKSPRTAHAIPCKETTEQRASAKLASLLKPALSQTAFGYSPIFAAFWSRKIWLDSLGLVGSSWIQSTYTAGAHVDRFRFDRFDYDSPLTLLGSTWIWSMHRAAALPEPSRSAHRIEAGASNSLGFGMIHIAISRERLPRLRDGNPLSNHNWFDSLGFGRSQTPTSVIGAASRKRQCTARERP
jgi:hypothetical protein